MTRDTSQVSEPAPARPGAGEARARMGALAGVLVIAALAYLPAAGGAFQWDDDVAVTGNPRVLAPSLLGWRDFVPPALGRDRPLTEVTLALNHAASGNLKAPFVATNVAIHLAAVVLAWEVVRAILRRARTPRAEWLALAVAALFALHPIQTEAVSYVCQRAESLAAALFLASLLLALRADERYAGGGRWAGWAVGAMVALLAGIAAKATAMTAPVVFLVVVAATTRKGERRASYWAVLIVPLAAAIAVGASAVAALGAGGDAGLQAGNLGPWRYLLTEAWVIPQYVRLLFWPPGQSVDHAVRESPGLLDPVTLACVAAVLGVVALALRLAREGRRPGGEPAAAAGAIGILWFLLVLAPTSSVVPLIDPMAEHRTYLANVGAFVAVVVAIDHWLRKWWREPTASRAGLALASAVLAGLTGLLVSRNHLWRDPQALWLDAARKAPLSFRPHQHAANALWAAGRREEAIAHYRRAVDVARPRTEAWTIVVRSYAGALASAERLGEARSVLAWAIRQAPSHAGLRESFAWILYGSGDYEGASAAVFEGRLVVPDSAELAAVAGKIAANRGDVETALQELQRAVALAPLSSPRRSDLAIVARMAGQNDRACAEIAQFIRLEKEPGARLEGANLLREWGCAGP